MTNEALQRENEELRRRLAEAEEVLAAIRRGQVDAIVVDSEEGARVFSLAGAETVYRLAVETMAEAAVNVTPEGTILFCNARFSEFVGTPIEKLVGRDVVELVVEEGRRPFRALLERCLDAPVQGRVVFCGPANVRRPTRVTGSKLSHPEGISVCLVGTDLTELEDSAHQIERLREVQAELRESRRAALAMMEDALAARRQAEQAALALSRSQEQLHISLRAAQAGSWDWNVQTGEIAWSPENYLLHDLDPSVAPLTYRDWESSLHPEDRLPTGRAVAEFIAGRLPEYRGEYRVQCRDGKLRWLLALGRVEYGPDGSPQRVSGINVDITDRKQAEEPVRRSAETFAILVEQSPLGIYTIDSRFRLKNVSAGALHTFRNVQPLIGRDFAEVLRAIWPEPFASHAVAIFRHTLDTGEPYVSPGLTHLRHDTGTVESYEWQINRVRLADGQDGVVCYFFDSTRLQQANRAVRESEQRFRALIGATSDVVYRMSRDWTAMHYLQGREFIADTLEPSRTWLDKYIHPDDQQQVLAAIHRAIETRSVFELEHRVIRVDGTLGWTHSRAVPMLDEHGEIVEWFGAASDVTQRKLAQAALVESEERFRTLADNMSQLAWMADEKGSISWYNRRWYDYTATTPEEMQGWGWKKVHHPAHVERVVETIARSLATGEPWEDIFPLQAKDGSYRWFLSRAVPIRNEQGKVVRWFGTNTDITEQRELEQALKEADRRKDEFLATLAHELRNPLAPIRTAAAIAGMPTATPAQVRWSYQLIERQVKHMGLLLDDLLDVSRITRGKLTLHPARVTLREMVHAAIETARPQIEGRRHALEVALPEDELALEADPLRLAQVLSNLLTNAAKYTEPGGRIGVSARRATDLVEITVTDTGMGIAPDQLERVFEMFTQLHPASHLGDGGLGIGLALARGLVELHGGSLEAKSDGIGLGAQFIVRLPLPQLEAARQPPAPRAAVVTTASQRILVVDDNVNAADSLATLLRLQGHVVRTAYEGEAALSVAAAFRPDYVLLDLGMPRMDGFEVARRLRAMEHGAGAIIVAITGWGQEADRMRSNAAGFDYHLTKPVGPEVLAEVLQRPPSTLRNACPVEAVSAGAGE